MVPLLFHDLGTWASVREQSTRPGATVLAQALDRAAVMSTWAAQRETPGGPAGEGFLAPVDLTLAPAWTGPTTVGEPALPALFTLGCALKFF